MPSCSDAFVQRCLRAAMPSGSDVELSARRRFSGRRLVGSCGSCLELDPARSFALRWSSSASGLVVSHGEAMFPLHPNEFTRAVAVGAHSEWLACGSPHEASAKMEGAWPSSPSRWSTVQSHDSRFVCGDGGRICLRVDGTLGFRASVQLSGSLPALGLG